MSDAAQPFLPVVCMNLISRDTDNNIATFGSQGTIFASFFSLGIRQMIHVKCLWMAWYSMVLALLWKVGVF